VLVPHDDAVKIEGAAVGERWLVLSSRQRAQQTVTAYALPNGGAMPTELGQPTRIEFDEPAYTLSGGAGHMACMGSVFLW
jgi:protease II